MLSKNVKEILDALERAYDLYSDKNPDLDRCAGGLLLKRAGESPDFMQVLLMAIGTALLKKGGRDRGESSATKACELFETLYKKDEGMKFSIEAGLQDTFSINQLKENKPLEAILISLALYKQSQEPLSEIKLMPINRHKESKEERSLSPRFF